MFIAHKGKSGVTSSKLSPSQGVMDRGWKSHSGIALSRIAMGFERYFGSPQGGGVVDKTPSRPQDIADPKSPLFISPGIFIWGKGSSVFVFIQLVSLPIMKVSSIILHVDAIQIYTAVTQWFHKTH